jgi:ribosomal protein S18 acetylase RimI-like enzyme
MIHYTNQTEALTASQLTGFFVGWPSPPSPETHLDILKGSYRVVLATDSDTGQVIGFVNAISDGVLSAYIPLLEVLMEYRGRGIGSELIRRLQVLLEGLYMVDLVCDPELEAYYTRLGFSPLLAMTRRDFDSQSGRKPGPKAR